MSFEKKERMGIFPTITEPAQKAAEALMAGDISQVKLEGKYNYFVAPEGTVDRNSVIHTFKHEGIDFVIFEDDSYLETE